jgi:signal transduction histidine kinase
LALDPVLGRLHGRHLVFLPTVMVAAWVGGFRPGLLSAIASTIAIDYFWTGSSNAFIHPDSQVSDVLELTLFFTASVAVCVLILSLETQRVRADTEAKSRERVLAIVAHDLRNPLGTITMATGLIRDGASGIDRHVATVERAVKRMDQLIGDLVDATRIETGELNLTLSHHEVAPIVEEIIEECRAAATRKGIVFEAEARGTVTCDRPRILQTLANLVSNALNFTPDGGRITVRAVPDGDGIRFEVADTGPGIPAEQLPHLFERHWHGSRDGLGLGLFIADNIVRAHGGHLKVESEPGGGAKFFFTIRQP